ncbi:MAG TPA: diol dehydratase small subunit [Dongiaceae bacterium]|jgi:propanediol dehydratase small subunit
MTAKPPQYPVGEREPERIKTASGRPLSALSLDRVSAGEVPAADLSITAEALRLQAQVARAAGRAPLAENFERAAELVAVPQAFVLEVYELLRPGRAAGRQELLDAAARLRAEFQAGRMAAFVEEAAAQYEERRLFRRRY